jgi:hypothetical protein
MRGLEPLIDGWLDCVRGDQAGVIRFDTESGMQGASVMGITDAELCDSMLDQTSALYAELPAGPDGEPFVTMTEDALSHAGVSAMLQETRLTFPTGDEEAERVQETVRALLGGESFPAYTGIAGDVMLSTMGDGAEQRFKDMVDLSKKSKTKKKKKQPSVGLTPELFAPLQTGPGMFVSIDFAALLRTVAPHLPDEAADVGAKLEGLPAGLGNLVYGFRLDAGGLTIELALPLAFLRAMSRLSADETLPG